MPALVEPTAVILDCADPAALAEFYRKATGWELTYSDENTAYLGAGGSVQLAFQRVEHYQPVKWPAAGQLGHIDFKVADMDVATKELVDLGATIPATQPGGDQWRVLADPAGHVFCIAA
ncbi:MAG TPA: VOC family protein [Pseudonocardiaceae bacterium]|jgi:catechol 2,3-dioxygenase-like lactoylglutathione lyase family enzyme|nr:VOC family protein [Pseudonocardiaceae bacterium]